MGYQTIPPNAVSMNTDEILSIAEVAGYLRCSKAHVYNAINGKVDGVSQLPAIHMGRRRLVRRSSLEWWKRQNERGVPVPTNGGSLDVPCTGQVVIGAQT